MLTVTTKEYAQLLLACEKAKKPLFVRGGFGIGKSAIPRQVFAKLAKEEGREFVEWAHLTLDQKKFAIENPDKYFAFMDARTSQMDTTSLQGIPNMTKTDLLENIPYSWVVHFTQPKARGVIFFDEINLAAPIVQSITYSAIHDRVIADRKLGDGVYVFAAGNRQKDRAHTYDMPMPLRDRFAEFELKVSTDEWIEFARNAGYNPHMVAFVSWKQGSCFTTDDKMDKNIDKPCTPRGIERASQLMEGLDLVKNENEVHLMASISCGEAFATEFGAYTKNFRKLKWEKIFANPSSVAEMPLDMQFAITGGLIEMYIKEPTNDSQFVKLMEVNNNLRADLAVHALRSMMAGSPNGKFGEMIRKPIGPGKKPYGPMIADRYGKFMMP